MSEDIGEDVRGADNLRRLVKSNSSIPSEIAAKNIDRSNFYEMPPDQYAVSRETLDPEVDSIDQVPNQVEEGVRKFASQSNQHSALIKEDYSKLNFIEKRIKYAKERIIDLPERRRELNDLYDKEFSGDLTGELSEEDKEYETDLRMDIEEMSNRTYGVDNEGEQFVVEVFSAIGDMLRTNKSIIAASAATGAGLGGLATLGVPIPGARVVGAGAGFVAGASTGVGLSFGLDAYKQTSRATYGELKYATDTKGNPLDLEPKRMKQVAVGVGLLSAVAAGLSGKVLSSKNPLMKKFISSKAAALTLSKSPELLAKMQILGSISASALAEGSEEAFQELVQIVGVNFGKMDESEASFTNALNNSLTGETLKRVTKAGILGAAVGTTITGASGALAHKRKVKAIKKSQDMVRVLEKQNSLVETAAAIKSTKVNDLAPNELTKFMQSIVGVDEEVLLTIEDMKEFANTPEKAELVKQFINPEVLKAANELNTVVSLNESDVLQIIAEEPTFSDYLRLEADGKNPKEVRSESQEQVARLDQAEAKRAEIEATLGIDEKLSPEDEAGIQNILTPGENVDSEIETEQEFLEDIRFEPIEGIVSEEDVQVLNTKELDARLEIAKITNEETEAKFDRIDDKILRDIDAKDVDTKIKSLDKEIKIVDKFKSLDKGFDAQSNEATILSNHKKKGFSPLAIEPLSLPEDLKEIYLKSGKLKNRKVFVTGGIDIEESAAMAGVDSGADLLKILSETPTKVEIKRNRVQRKIELRNRVEQTTLPARKIARDAAFTKITKLRLKQMDHFRSREWPTVKRGVVKIIGKTPTVEGLNRKAVEIVNKTQIKDLSPKKYEYGENKSKKKAVDNWLKTEFEQSYKNVEASALNNELRKESINAKEKVARFEKFWKRVESESNQKTLKDAGMLKTMQEFTDVYRLTGKDKGRKELNSFNKFIKKQDDRGNFTPVIPTRLDDVTKSVKEMTMEQYTTISEMGVYILKQAKLKNKLAKLNEDRTDFRTGEKVQQDIKEETEAHPNFDAIKADKTEKYDNTIDAIAGGVSRVVNTVMTTFSTLKTVPMELDNFISGGYFQNLITFPVKKARDVKRGWMYDIDKSDKGIVNNYGLKKFHKMFNEFLVIPEFNNIPELSDGNMRKIDLLTMMAYMGDPEGRKSLGNFVTRKGERIDAETVLKVLDRELTKEDAKLVQELMVNRFKQFEKPSFDLHKKTAGVEPTMVKGVPFNHRGVEIEGGYYPVSRTILPDDMKAAKIYDSVKNRINNFQSEETEFFSTLRTAEMTEQGRLKERSGSDRPLDLTFENMNKYTEEAVHDLAFRETGIDILKVLKDPTNVKNMKSVIGKEKFVNLLNSVKDVISKTTEQESTLFGDEYRIINGIVDKAHTLHAIKVIGYNYKSALIQPTALTNLSLRAGPKSQMYMFKLASKLATNPLMIHEYTRIATEINPDLKFEQDKIDSAINVSGNGLMVKTQNFLKTYNSKRSQRISSIRELQKRAIDHSFFMVQQGDRINKVLATMALSEQFMNGDMEGWSKERVDKLSVKERATTMQNVVRGLIDLSLTASAPEDKSAPEKLAVMKTFLRFFVDRRNILNSMSAQGQKIKISVKQKDYGQASLQVLNMSYSTGVAIGVMAAIRAGLGETADELEKIDTGKEFAELARDTALHFVTAPVAQLADVLPFVDSVNYAAGMKTRSDYRNVGNPFTGVQSDLSMGYNALKDILKMAVKGKEPRLSKVQTKALLTNAGYAVGGAPTNAAWKLIEAMKSREVRKVKTGIKSTVKELKELIDLYSEENKDNPEAEKFINDLQEYKDKMLPVTEIDVNELITEGTKIKFKAALSGGQWDAYNESSGAAGVYQFTEDRWNEMMVQAPFLALTEDGRVAKDPAEQEKAMDWNMKDISKDLLSLEIPVTQHTIFGAHKFGIDNYVFIHEAEPSEKLSEVLGDESKDPMFKDFETVKSINTHIDDQLNIKENDK